MKKITIFLLSAFIFIIMACEKYLDKPQLNNFDDNNYWTNPDETNLRLFANGFYSNYFNGYNSSWTIDYTPLRGYIFHDDVVTSNKQLDFPTVVPSDLNGSAWQLQFCGPQWYFNWVRKANLFAERLERLSKSNIPDEAYRHWMAVAYFYRAFEYARLVSVFGDVPYYNTLISDTDVAELCKPRTPRGEVMDGVYEDLKYALANIRLSDGTKGVTLNRDVVAAYIARFMLFEGTWQKYHYNNSDKAKKYLEFALEAGNFLMTRGYQIDGDFRSLFGSQNLANNKEMIIYRHYEMGLVTHCIASYSNRHETQTSAANLDLMKAFINQDGTHWSETSPTDPTQFEISNLVTTRDSRLEASFSNKYDFSNSSSGIFINKFISRAGEGSTNAIYTSNTNTNDAPIMRYAEVLLNWIETKAELATLGGTPVTQDDIDKSINLIRKRPLAPEAIDKGIQQTAAMNLSSLPNDANRDSDVPELIWEIRRERRMELAMEYSRLLDIKRWKKLEYMNYNNYPDKMLGGWVDMTNVSQNNIPANFSVKKTDGTVVVWNKNNQVDLLGFYIPTNVANRDVFTDKQYLSPVPLSQIDFYQTKGYELKQTVGW